jgi:ABC-2 type transport system ATP-binding protein
MPPTPVASFSAVCLTYPGAAAPALNGLSLTVHQGEVLGLLGPNGAGKTTAISVLCGLLRPDSGTVECLGLAYAAAGGDIRQNLGLVPQDLALYPTLTARENLDFIGRMYGLHGRALAERLDACLSAVGLSDAADRPIQTYSGGMKRRANLAAGILHRPKLLVLDEPTVGVDAQSRNAILELLTELNRQGTTIIHATHYMEEIERTCGRAAVIDQGRIIADGSPAGLVAEHPGCTTLQDVFMRLTGRQFRDA